MIQIKINTAGHDKTDCLMLLEYLKGSMETLGFGYILDVDYKDVDIDRQNIREVEHEPKQSVDDAYNEMLADEQVGKDLLDKGEITEEEYNNLFQQDHDDQNKEVDDEMDKREREYRSDGYNRPIDP